MNKIIKLSSLILVLSILFHACSEDSISTNEIISNDFELNSELTLNKTTSKVSSLFFNMGVTSISVTKNNESTLYEFISEKTFFINGKSIDLSNYSVLLKNGMISINSTSNLNLTLFDGKPYVESSNYSGFLDSQEYFESVDFNILLLVMKEITTDNDVKIDSQKALNSIQNRASCSFWDTYYVYNTGGNLSVATAGLDDEIAEHSSGFNTLSVEGCSTIGDVNTSCLWGEHACVASQAFCCD